MTCIIIVVCIALLLLMLANSIIVTDARQQCMHAIGLQVEIPQLQNATLSPLGVQSKHIPGL